MMPMPSPHSHHRHRQGILFLQLLVLLLNVVRGALQIDAACQSHLPLDEGPVRLHRAITTSSSLVQALYDQASVLAAAFNHEEAVRSLEAALVEDPGCLSCYTALAGSLAPNINRPTILQASLNRAREALSTAFVLPPFKYTGVELALLRAMAERFPLERTLENGAVYDKAYATSMGQVRKDYPQDIDVAVWWAEATLTTMPWDYYIDEATGVLKPETEEVRAVLETVLDSSTSSTSSKSKSDRDSSFPKKNQHPLALHLYVHLMEPSPLLRPRALSAALALRNMTSWSPGHGHLLHMPGHIFIRTPQTLHLASEANQQAIVSDRQYFKLCPATTKWGYYKQLYFGHKHAFLLFSSGLEGRKSLAFQTGQELYGECNINLVSHILGGSFVAYPVWPWLAHYLRFGEWEAAEQVTAGKGDVSFVQTMQYFVRGFALASQGKCDKAWGEMWTFEGMVGRDESGGEVDVFLVKAKDLYRVAIHSLRARLASAGCTHQEEQHQQHAVSEWKRAVGILDSFPYMEPPFWPLNLRACQGQALLDEGRFEEAEEVYRQDLVEWPGNIWSSKGLVLALQAQVGREGKREEVRRAQEEFEKASEYMDFDLEERSCF